MTENLGYTFEGDTLIFQEEVTGIQPILAKVSFSDTPFFADLPITGSGDVTCSDCGKYFVKGCLDVEKHKGFNLFGVDMTAKAYVKRIRYSCHKPLCPVCWRSWANREAKKAVHRLQSFSLKGRSLKPVHIVVSVPSCDYGLSLLEMRRKVYRAIKQVNFIGGLVIYHSKRFSSELGAYYSPHFHMLGYGWLVNIREQFRFSGYVIKNLGIRKTLKGTIFYQLSHCGVCSCYHTVVWVGALSYRKLRVKAAVLEKDVCPVCEGRLYGLAWVGSGAVPVLEKLEGSDFFDEKENWIYQPLRFSRGFLE